MTASITATEIWRRENEAAIHVIGKTQYRVTFYEGEVHITGPGVDVTVELDEEPDDYELAALVFVGMFEGGMEL